MEKQTKEDLNTFLSASQEEVLIQIGMLAEPSTTLTAPDELFRRAKSFVRSIKPKLSEQCCQTFKSVSGPELELASAILALISKDYQPVLAAALAAYVIKRGYAWLCEGKEDD